ncbi:MAG: hypothetical protein ACI9R3_006069 [Verrucomicrobiales bacterium]|jgi:hypothetical protein
MLILLGRAHGRGRVLHPFRMRLKKKNEETIERIATGGILLCVTK